MIVVSYFYCFHFISSSDVEWIEDIYHTCQRLGKVEAPISGDVSCLSRYSSFDDSSYPINVSNLFYSIA